MLDAYDRNTRELKNKHIKQQRFIDFHLISSRVESIGCGRTFLHCEILQNDRNKKEEENQFVAIEFRKDLVEKKTK